MKETISSTHQYLLTHYGPLLTLKHVAEIMHSTPNAIRMVMARKNQPFALALATARRKLGRRVYFEARRIAEAIDRNGDEEPSSPDFPTKHEDRVAKIGQHYSL